MEPPRSLRNRANNAIYLKTQWKSYPLYSGSLHWMSINKGSRWKRRERLLTCKPKKKSTWRRLLPAVSAVIEDGPRRCTLLKWRRIKTIRASSRRFDSQARRQSEAGDWRCLPLWKAARSLEGRAARKKIWPEARLNLDFHSCVFKNHLLRFPGQMLLPLRCFARAGPRAKFSGSQQWGNTSKASSLFVRMVPRTSGNTKWFHIR